VNDDDILGLVLGKLDGVRKCAGYWKARCPAHEDREPSLTVGRGTSQPVVLNCHAGCDRDAILAAIGLTFADICTPRERPAPNRMIARYLYADEHGEVLFAKVRYPPKRFIIEHPDGRGDWAPGIGTDRRVLYRLPRILAAADSDVVFVAEGEKDCDALEAAGEIATCNFDGAGKWQPGYSRVLAGRDVLVVADKDAEGRAHARMVAGNPDGLARSCWIVEAAAGKDAADHLAAGFSVTDFAWWSR